MAQSIQRGNDWWNQRPDGVWLKWSNDSQAWVPQSSGPPPPSAPNGPFSSAQAPSGQFPPVKVDPRPTPITARAAGIPTETEAKPEKPAINGRQAVMESVGEAAAARPPANTPIVSVSKKRMPPIRENKILLGFVGGLVILATFLGTYVGATAFFQDGASAASAHEKKMKPPKGFTKAKWNYILKMDEYCQNFNSQGELKEMAERMMVVESEEELIALVREFRAKFLEGTRVFREGPLPKQDRELLNRIFALHQSAGEFFDRMVSAIENLDLAGLQAIINESIAKARLEKKLMGRYGFQYCGRITV